MSGLFCFMAGRPTDYREEFNEQVFKLCLLGATDKEIGDFFEVTEQTINNWKQTHPEFFESIKKGKFSADSAVAERLFKRAVGYAYKETSYEKIVVDKPAEPEDEEAEGENIEIDLYKKKVVHKELAPDTIAAIFWLKNRQKDKWRDKQEYDLNHNGTINWNEEKTYEAHNKADQGA